MGRGGFRCRRLRRPPPVAPQRWDARQIAAAREELDRLAQAAPTEVEAILEPLGTIWSGRWRRRLPPDEKKRRPTAEQQRLLAGARYRLLASDKLALRWPGGMMQLASLAAPQRHQAAARLVEHATADDQPLFSELFRDTDPLIREMALRGLQRAGGKNATDALVMLLDDPDPNVVAAVLKQLAETPGPELVGDVGWHSSARK